MSSSSDGRRPTGIFCWLSLFSRSVYSPLDEDSSCFTSHFPLYKGLVYSSISSIFFSICAVIVKGLPNIHPGQLAVCRFIGIFVITLPVVVWSGRRVLGPRHQRHFLVLRGIVGSTNLFLNFLAFRYLPIGEASVVIFSVPVFVSVMARIFLKEPCGMLQTVAIACTILGIILITKFPMRLMDNEGNAYSEEHIVGISSALASLVFGAGVFILLRKLKHVHHTVVLFNFGWVAILETTLLTALTGNFSLPDCGVQQWLVLALGALSFGGQSLITLAAQCEQAGPVATVRSATDIALAFVWQVVIFKETPDAMSISGALLVGFSVVLLGVWKWMMGQPRDDARGIKTSSK